MLLGDSFDSLSTKMAPTKVKLSEIKITEIPRLSKYFLNLPPSKLEKTEFCHIWKGYIKDEYGSTKICIEKKDGSTFKKHWRVHRWAYFAKYKSYKGFDNESDRGVSHLCGHKLCANVDHLSYEDAHTNISRIKCHDQGFCNNNHGSYPNCVFKDDPGEISKLQKLENSNKIRF